MSIQSFAKKSVLTKFKNMLSLLLQVVNRSTCLDRPRVFFRYSREFTHPSFKRFYQKPPLKWANAYNYEMAHWINYPSWINQKPFILEINDHPLSAVTYKNRAIYEPVDVLKNLQDANKVFMHPTCRKILLPDSGMEEIFKYYFGEVFNPKISSINCPGCLSKYTQLSDAGEAKYGVACLASDYELKGVDLVLKAWRSVDNKKDWKLYLACPNIPQNEMQVIKDDESIVVINKAPLTEKEKNKILSSCSITLAPTHIHGGANIIEGMEYGHAIVHFSSHSSGYDGVGERIQVPYHFYSPKDYGIAWKTIKDFQNILKRDKKNGAFDSVVMNLVNVISSLINDFDRLATMRNLSFNSAKSSHSLAKRNKELIAIYSEVVATH